MINTFRMPRPIMGVAHSYGAVALANVALHNSRLVSSIVMMDPVMEIPNLRAKQRYTTPTWLSGRRRDAWPSLEAVREIFAKIPVHQT